MRTQTEQVSVVLQATPTTRPDFDGLCRGLCLCAIRSPDVASPSVHGGQDSNGKQVTPDSAALRRTLREPKPTMFASPSALRRPSSSILIVACAGLNRALLGNYWRSDCRCGDQGTIGLPWSTVSTGACPSTLGKQQPASLVAASDAAGWDAHRAVAPPPSPPPPGTRLSSAMRAFSDDDQRRRRSVPERALTVVMRAR